jgi:hypothetical protein
VARGNGSELKHAIERAAVLLDKNRLAADRSLRSLSAGKPSNGLRPVVEPQRP